MPRETESNLQAWNSNPKSSESRKWPNEDIEQSIDLRVDGIPNDETYKDKQILAQNCRTSSETYGYERNIRRRLSSGQHSQREDSDMCGRDGGGFGVEHVNNVQVVDFDMCRLGHPDKEPMRMLTNSLQGHRRRTGDVRAAGNKCRTQKTDVLALVMRACQRAATTPSFLKTEKTKQATSSKGNRHEASRQRGLGSRAVQGIAYRILDGGRNLTVEATDKQFDIFQGRRSPSGRNGNTSRPRELLQESAARTINRKNLTPTHGHQVGRCQEGRRQGGGQGVQQRNRSSHVRGDASLWSIEAVDNEVLSM